MDDRLLTEGTVWKEVGFADPDMAVELAERGIVTVDDLTRHRAATQESLARLLDQPVDHEAHSQDPVLRQYNIRAKGNRVTWSKRRRPR